VIIAAHVAAIFLFACCRMTIRQKKSEGSMNITTH
jgi:hypothetical protein